MFERDLGDGWEASAEARGIAGMVPQFDLRSPTGRLIGWMDAGEYEHVSGAIVPARILLAFLYAYREWSLQQPEGSPDRAEWEKAP